MRLLLAISLTTLIAACSTAPTGRYSQRHDSAPHRLPTEISLHDAVPTYEDQSRGGNAPYQVFGQHYTPIETAKDFQQQGEASWYGQKFHGHLTSNGEVYDMYAMTAAHKTLPLPSFVRVTNLVNNKQVIVRVNDRGPFHGGRIIDLSYAAAMKLDMLKTGTTKVKLDAIHVEPDGTVMIAGEPQLPPLKPVDGLTKAWFVQVAALSDGARAEQLAKGLETLYQLPTHVPQDNGIYRLRLGPLDDEGHARQLMEELKRNGYDKAYPLYAPH
ncbi:septal ring lytic transglycosylase RlpA family protein [Bowmanella sp. Y26]|uniref:septal ring lytic transglycosylase RlpA family protein n=1 Tax=Bowmanella yangjiangensis TaxID=2811230 RepID=UPI001BDBE321|nr:septal ring lytic transglycosylase RlpA family protein [Bowmanella yangjiangensis]MBT1065590.1 septal ring lytic transglycosylase RlpA family protein [Bowmanella yangjiangensis]